MALGTIFAVVSSNAVDVRPTTGVTPFFWKSKALTPAMNGVAMDVPDSTPKLPRGMGRVERMLPPGAATAGLKNISFVGPYEVKEEIRPPEGSGKEDAPPL